MVEKLNKLVVKVCIPQSFLRANILEGVYDAFVFVVL